MEIYDDESLDDFISIKIIGIGASGASALNYFSDVGHDIFPERLIIADENDVANVQDFVDACDWLFVIMDVEDLELAKRVAECIEESKKLPTASSTTIPSYSAPPKLIYNKDSQFLTVTFDHADLISKEFKLPLVTF